MLSSGMLTPLFFIFPGNFTHSGEGRTCTMMEAKRTSCSGCYGRGCSMIIQFQLLACCINVVLEEPSSLKSQKACGPNALRYQCHLSAFDSECVTGLSKYIPVTIHINKVLKRAVQRRFLFLTLHSIHSIP
jgi:hypothetical protein